MNIFIPIGICLSSDEKAKHAYFSQRYPTDGGVLERILDTLTPDDMRVLMKFQDEVGITQISRRFKPVLACKYLLRHVLITLYYNIAVSV